MAGHPTNESSFVVWNKGDANAAKAFGISNAGVFKYVHGASELVRFQPDGNVNIAGIITATGADINGDLDVDGHTNLDNVSIAGVTTMTVGGSGVGSVVKINKDGTSELTGIYNNNAATLAINDSGTGAQIVLRGQSPKLIFDQSAGGNGSVYYDSGDLIFYKGVPVGSPSNVEVVRFNHSGVTVSGIVTATSFSGNGANLTGIDTDLVSDTSPQLGGTLDGNGQTANFTANNTGLGIPIGLSLIHI